MPWTINYDESVDCCFVRWTGALDLEGLSCATGAGLNSCNCGLSVPRLVITWAAASLIKNVALGRAAALSR